MSSSPLSSLLHSLNPSSSSSDSLDSGSSALPALFARPPALFGLATTPSFMSGGTVNRPSRSARASTCLHLRVHWKPNLCFIPSLP
ncbi:hypothetical protein PPROV_000012300 [Pycnococcus provasolii]|uniref:Uncharacterized protein n=1 Tax=Pycnococcus provasolii TaxID=41880 RepID=A0A830H8B7_9CHLO|nr:hypothetical protein PPROV_000012300 [Pycnococcus provasolii]